MAVPVNLNYSTALSVPVQAVLACNGITGIGNAGAGEYASRVCPCVSEKKKKKKFTSVPAA